MHHDARIGQLLTIEGTIAEVASRDLMAWEADLTVSFTRPNGATLQVPGFAHRGRWYARAALPDEGDWNYEARVGDTVLEKGSVSMSAGVDPFAGGLAIDRENPRRFALRDGAPVFLLSYESDWLFDLEMRSPGEGRVDAFLEKIRDSGFNCVMMNCYAHDTSWALGHTEPADHGPPTFFPWAGSNESPDFEAFNPDFWEGMDRVVESFWRAGMFLHLFFKVYNKLVHWPDPRSAADEAFFRHVVARYQAYPCMIWDFAKETYYEIDKAYVRTRMRQIGEWDAHNRLRTVHDDLALIADTDAANDLDFCTAQQHHDFHASVILEHARRDWPYVNSEHGYESGPGGVSDVTYGVGQSAQELVRRAWVIACSGGYPAYYYTYSAWDLIREEDTPPGYAFFRTLGEFFRAVDFRRFEPAPELCLWRSSFCLAKGDPQSPEEVIYFIENHVLTPPEVCLDNFSGEWLNVYDGRRIPLSNSSAHPCVDRNEYTIYTAPFTAPHAVLHLHRRSGSGS